MTSGDTIVQSPPTARADDHADGTADAHAEVPEMRIALLCIVLAVGGSVLVTMLFSFWRHRSHDATSGHYHAVVGYAWAVAPWIVVAIFLAQTVYNILTVD